MVWIKFIVCSLVIFFAGHKVAKYGDMIAEKTGLCRAWLGLTLLVAVTSLPELANAVSATTANLPELAVGDILGACMINVLTLAMLDIILWFRGRKSIFIKSEKNNILSALFGMGLLSFVAFSLAVTRYFIDFQIFGVSGYTLAIVLIYLVIQKILYSQSQAEKTEEKKHYDQVSSFKTYLGFLLCALIVIIAGGWLPFIGAEIVEIMGWGRTFVAVLFLGFATTLPEATVSLSALRLGSVGMGIGNLLGSNIFNVAILFVADVFYQPGDLLTAVPVSMIFAALFGALLTFIVFLALEKRIKNRIPSLLIVFCYLLSLFLLFKASAM